MIKKIIWLAIISLLVSLSSCSMVLEDKYNVFSPRVVYVASGGGSVTIHATDIIIFSGVECCGMLKNAYKMSYEYPYSFNTEWCTVELTAPKTMNVVVFKSEEAREIMLHVSGYDKNGILLSPDIIEIYQTGSQ